jgi:ribosomal protein L10
MYKHLTPSDVQELKEAYFKTTRYHDFYSRKGELSREMVDFIEGSADFWLSHFDNLLAKKMEGVREKIKELPNIELETEKDGRTVMIELKAKSTQSVLSLLNLEEQ